MPLATLSARSNNADDAAGRVRALLREGEAGPALEEAERAFALLPSGAHASLLAVALGAAGRHAEALAACDLALAERPADLAARVRRALALDGLGRGAEAIAAGWQALALAPDHAAVRYHQAERLLREGRLTRGTWALFESRLELAGLSPSAGVPLWGGEAMPSGTLLLLAEQGLGDTLQFVRYAPLAAARAGRVVLAVPKPLVPLLQDVPGVDAVVSTAETLPPFDRLCPLLSLPGLFGTTLATVPPPLPYATHPARGRREGPLRVGLVWAGAAGFAHDAARSLDPERLTALAGVPGVRLFSLQHHGERPPAWPEALGMADLMGGVEDFAATATIVAGLDAVIGVDTAVVHLAATMGLPVWLLSRFNGCWRWLAGRDDSPWYPTLRIARQERPGDWDAPLDRVRNALADMAA